MTSADMYEDDTKYFHKTLCFAYIRDTEKNDITTRSVLIAVNKIRSIERALDQFSDQEKEDIKKIFFKGHSQVYAEINDGISKDMYYHLKDKMIYLTAVEYGQI